MYIMWGEDCGSHIHSNAIEASLDRVSSPRNARFNCAKPQKQYKCCQYVCDETVQGCAQITMCLSGRRSEELTGDVYLSCLEEGEVRGGLSLISASRLPPTKQLSITIYQCLAFQCGAKYMVSCYASKTTRNVEIVKSKDSPPTKARRCAPQLLTSCTISAGRCGVVLCLFMQ